MTPCELFDYQYIAEPVNQLISGLFIYFLTVKQSIFYLSDVFSVVLQLFTTPACMSRCVVRALTYLGKPRWPRVPTCANPLPAMAYTRC